MKKYLLLSMLAGLSLASATTVSWLDGGSVVNTLESKEINSTVTKSVSSTKTDKSKVTLATGEEINLTGGVYVKVDKSEAVLKWAKNNGYEAKEDKYTKGAVHIVTTVEQSILVANAIANLEGVTTAAPKFRRKLIRK
jgi:hypothetical protein